MALANYFYNDFFGDVDRAMENTLGRFFNERSGGYMDVIDMGDRFELVGDFPGFDPQDIVIEHSDGMISVKAERKKEGRGSRWQRSFYKSFTLPHNVDAENIGANLDKGVLTLTLPKLPEENKKNNIRRIAIK